MSWSSDSNNWNNILSSTSFLNYDGSKIYSYVCLGSFDYIGVTPSSRLYIVNFNTNDGSVIGARYKSSGTCFYVNDAILNGDLFIASLLWQGYGIMIYNIQTSTFILKYIKYKTINGVLIEKLTQR